MGSGIACHFANIGVEVLLLDIVPRELNEKEKAKGLTLEDKIVRNRLVTLKTTFQRSLKSIGSSKLLLNDLISKRWFSKISKSTERRAP